MGYLVKSYDIAVVPSRKLLCIAQLPSFYDDKDLRELVLEFGEPTKCFMYRCIETGTFYLYFMYYLLYLTVKKITSMHRLNFCHK